MKPACPVHPTAVKIPIVHACLLCPKERKSQFSPVTTDYPFPNPIPPFHSCPSQVVVVFMLAPC